VTYMEAASWLWPLLAAMIVVALAVWHFLRAQRLRTIFVSYRRSDSASQTQQIVAGLRQRFSHQGVFHDVVSITPGENFRSAIARTLRRCDAALVMIGPDWASCVDAEGQLRLQASDDVVRSEVATALASGALTVPVLVGGATLPELQHLPPDLRALRDCNAVILDPTHGDAADTALATAIRAAPMRRTLGFLGLCHISVVVQLTVFFVAGGLLPTEFTTALAIVTPALAGVMAVDLVQRLSPAHAPARVTRVPPSALLVPLLFVTGVSALVVLRGLNNASFEAFKIALTTVELGFAGYTGVVLASLQENRSPP
jgi:hypothetical protein